MVQVSFEKFDYPINEVIGSILNLVKGSCLAEKTGMQQKYISRLTTQEDYHMRVDNVDKLNIALEEVGREMLTLKVNSDTLIADLDNVNRILKLKPILDTYTGKTHSIKNNYLTKVGTNYGRLPQPIIDQINMGIRIEAMRILSINLIPNK